MMKLSDFNRRLLEIRTIPDQIETLLDAVIEVVHANKGFVISAPGRRPRGRGGAQRRSGNDP